MDWNDPDHLRELATALMENPAKRMTVQGPRGEVTDTVEQLVGRLGMSDLGGSYFTFSNENNYMIWTFLKQCWQRGWLYRGADVMPWCSRCATGISQHEIVTDGYQELTHTSITLRLPLRGRERGVAAGVDHYTLGHCPATWWRRSARNSPTSRSGRATRVLYLSKGTLHMLRGPYEVVGEMPGSALEGWTYDGPFDGLEAACQPGGNGALRDLAQDGVGVRRRGASRRVVG